MTIKNILYHYTSKKGLRGILKTNKLWMTNIFYLNDSSEFTYTLNLVKSELKKRENSLPPFRKIGGLMNLINDQEENTRKKYVTLQVIGRICETFINMNNEIKFKSYVFSLSRREDNLSQWRSYCPKEGGYSIGFDHLKLLSIVTNFRESCFIERCKYDPKEIQELINSFLDPIDTSFESNKDLSERELSSDIITKIIYHSSFIKDESFKEEEEYRIVKGGVDIGTISHREGESMIIPYIELSPVDDDNRLPISKIFVGPTPHPELSKLSVKSLLESYGYENVEVEISKIPYRSW